MLLASMIGAAASAAQTPGAADSARVLRGARDAQARFESVRRRHLPTTWSSGGGCDERIGRFCLTHDDSDQAERAPDPPPEAEATRQARDRLVDELARAASRLPGDRWIAGQRVRYLAEAGRHGEAVGAARDCRAAAEWCTSLAGFAHHAAGDHRSADSLFAVALAAMPPRERAEWLDLSPLIEPAERGAVRRAGPERFWWLADPLWSVPGNERRTEHFARHVWDALQDRTRSPEAIGWGWDLRELLIRYGWPIAWERARPEMAGMAVRPGGIVSHYPPRARRWEPPARVLPDPTRIEPDDWPLRVRSARSEYRPGYARRFVMLDHQFARFLRGDSLLLVGVGTPPPDSGKMPDSLRVTSAALWVMQGPRSVAHSAVRTGPATGVALLLAMPNQPALASLEMIERGDSGAAAWAGRARAGVRPLPAGVPAASDLLLVRAGATLPRSLDEAAAAARPDGGRVAPGERVGLYWEAYRLPAEPGAEVTVALRLDRRDRRLGRRDAPVELRFRERYPGGPTFARSLGLGVPADLAPGVYTLTLSVIPDGGAALTSSRTLRVAAPGARDPDH